MSTAHLTLLLMLLPSHPNPTGGAKCDKCNIPVASGGCQCNSNCDCITSGETSAGCLHIDRWRKLCAQSHASCNNMHAEWNIYLTSFSVVSLNCWHCLDSLVESHIGYYLVEWIATGPVA